MAIDYSLLGKRIAYYRNEHHISQEELGQRLYLSRQYISRLETGLQHPSLDTIVDIANELSISADKLLVDSLNGTQSEQENSLSQLLLDCTSDEKKVILKIAQELKTILYSLGI